MDRHVAQTHQIPVNELCCKASWPLYKKYNNAFEAYKKLLAWLSEVCSRMGQKAQEAVEDNGKRRADVFSGF